MLVASDALTRRRVRRGVGELDFQPGARVADPLVLAAARLRERDLRAGAGGQELAYGLRRLTPGPPHRQERPVHRHDLGRLSGRPEQAGHRDAEDLREVEHLERLSPARPVLDLVNGGLVPLPAPGGHLAGDVALAHLPVLPVRAHVLAKPLRLLFAMPFPVRHVP